ncbi:MAG: hypothetical protein AAGI50_03300 [Pseudomonadota bacterium]
MRWAILGCALLAAGCAEVEDRWGPPVAYGLRSGAGFDGGFNTVTADLTRLRNGLDRLVIRKPGGRGFDYVCTGFVTPGQPQATAQMQCNNGASGTATLRGNATGTGIEIVYTLGANGSGIVTL